MPRVFAHINPMMLVWAREQRGFDRITAAKKIGIAPEKLAACEDPADDAELTIPQLRNASKTYQRPMALFYLREPPPTPKKLPDFRRLPENIDSPLSPELRLEIRKIQEKRKAAVDLVDYGPQFDWSWVGSISLNDDPEEVGQNIRHLLGIDESLQRSRKKDHYAALRGWRIAMESVGALVFQISGIALEEMRGFCIAEEPYPALAVNRKDPPQARCFSVVHEFCHVMLGESGLSDLSDTAYLGSDRAGQIEQFCNHAAGAALVPADVLLDAPEVANHGRDSHWEESDLRDLARFFCVSVEAVLRRLLVLNRTSQSFYRSMRQEWAERPKPEKPSGPVPEKGYEKVIRTQGSAYARLILEALHGDAITAGSASEYLDMKMKHLPALEQAVLVGNG
ncbi:MAG: ImmA/IrrE family metallo-endopeptidase [Spiribacter salinus]|uniref:ImmA/IrrE family metallo-endopeptidase n=1 Tax=Spiribacter salinus TaxID=1335746 RepID=A0A540VPM1_9GAMM|nr:MAG: ImmA/IrrE family metallo-endopeptidase [Spiribacter salinus]